MGLIGHGCRDRGLVIAASTFLLIISHILLSCQNDCLIELDTQRHSRTGGSDYARSSFAACTMFAADGTAAASSVGLMGIGTSAPQTLFTGASR